MTARSLCIAVLLAAACGGKSETKTPPASGSGAKRATGPYVMPKDAPDGLDVKLSNGKAGPEAYDRAKLAPAKKLGAAEANAVLARSKPIQRDPDDQQPFALRPGSQPPPRTGTTITATFPPPPSSLVPPKGNDAGKDLTVLRYMPQGQVPLAPELSVTFSQPMVAVTSQGDASATTPVKLSPQPKGKWRWIGTRTILFDPETRFPQATTYKVEIPAGTKSAVGNALAKPTAFSFETPPVGLVSAFPSQYEPQHLDAPMFLLFDQKIDAQAVLAKLKVTAATTRLELRLLDAKEIASYKQLAATIDAAKQNEQDGRWLAFKATKDFPADTQVTIEIPAGTPSAEGPNLTKAPQTHHFRTYPPLRLVGRDCDYSTHRCAPGQALVIEANNPLDEDKFDEQLVSVSPALPGAHIYVSGAALIVDGPTRARTQYKITVGKQLTDQFAQQLGKEQALAFQIGDAYPTFFGPNGIVVLDPVAPKQTLDFFTTNYEQLKVRLYKVTPADFDAFRFYVANQWNHDKPPKVPGAKVFDQLVKTTPGKNELVETSVDLAPALVRGLGHAIAIVEPYPWKERYEPPRHIAWVQSTKLAVDAYVDADQLIGFTTELATGKPASGVALELRPFGTTTTSNDKGLATLALSAPGPKGGHMLLAKRGEDTAFVVDEYGYHEDGGTWFKQARPTTLAWYVIDDRKMYKPGEEVSLKGWLRMVDQGKNGDVGALRGQVVAVTYTVHDSQGNQIANGTAQVNAAGGFDTKFTLPKTPNLGSAWIDFAPQAKDAWNAPTSAAYRHQFQIEEFRRPEFEVSAAASQGPMLVGDSGDITVSAKYFSGGPLPGAPVQWNVTAQPTTFTPPNRDDFVFGEWRPWWGYRGGFDDDEGYGYGRGGRYKPPKSWNLAAKTDATGAHVLHLDFLSVKPALPMSLTANANVTDVNRQTWSAASALIVHPADYYVGLKTKKPFVLKGTPFQIDVIGVDLDGKAVPGAKVALRTVRLDYEVKNGRYKTKEVDPQTCQVIAAKDPQPCHFATKDGGTYQTTATIVDQRGRPNTTKITFWVAGGKQPLAREVERERVELIPDKKEYAPGTTAELLVQAPFFPAEAVVSWRRSGIVKTERIAITGPTHVIKVPITDAMTPNLVVQVDLVGAAARLDDKGDPDPKLPKRPAYAVGAISLPIPPKQRTLDVKVAPNAAKLAPGEKAKVAVTVKDAQGKPVPGAEAAVIVVDEAILALTGYQFTDPISTFYAGRSADARDYYLQSYIKLARPDLTRGGGGSGGRGMAKTKAPSRRANGGGDNPLADERSRMVVVDKLQEAEQPLASAAPEPAQGEATEIPPMEEKKPEKPKLEANKDGKESGGETGGVIAIRSNFNPLAAFAPAVKTDASGKATVELKLPDNLTRYRIVAVVASGDKHFGKGESALTARLPLMVRPSPPRFLNFGDTFKLPVVVQNQTDAPMTVKLAARTTNAMLTDGAGREVMVPANDRVEVQFPAAAEMAGTARFQIVGTAGGASDAAELALPVWTPATTEAFATYGTLDSGAMKQPVALPGKVVAQYGGLEITTSSTTLQNLTDAMLYLVHYPFECAEQRSSRVMAVAALRDVLTAFKTKDMPSVSAMEASVKADLEHLSQMQNGDGGFAFWDRGHPSEPYLTVHVTSALVHAQKKGYPVPPAMLTRAKNYLQTIESRYPWYYGPDIRRTISSYALYTRKQMGDVDIAKGKRIIAEAGGVAKLSMEANGWLLGTFAGNAGAATERTAIVRHAMNKVSETAGAANFTTAYGDGAYLLLASDRRVDAVMLESLIQEQKDSDLIPKLVTGLLAHRKAGRWLNTQENTFALLAMDRYFQTYEKTTPDFVARVWLGNDYAGDHAFKGRTTDYFTIPIPMKQVAAHDKQDLTIQKDGTGRLYYRIGMRYAPASLKLEPADHGFVVERIYEGADDPKDVTRTPDGTWHVKAGARVRVKLKLVNENRRYHVALVDPMPAGFEPMNPALAVTGPIPTDPNEQKSRGAYWWWYGPWYEHQNMRDERVEAFAALLWEGVHRYDYVARATTPGNFVVPPPKAEEMYMPETFGRGGSDRVIVE